MRILVIEEDTHLQRFLARLLRTEGFVVDLSERSADGLLMAKCYEFDVIVVASRFADMTYQRALGDIRDATAAPIMVVFSEDKEHERIDAWNRGADDCVNLPISGSELVARINALIRRSAGQPLPEIEMGEYKVDLVGKQVMRWDQVVELTGLEFGLVEYLAVNRGKVVSRTELNAHLYDEMDTCLSNRLDARVSRIRRKLGRDFIKTHRGFGYSIN